MSEIGDVIQEKCISFADCIIKLNDYLLEQAVSAIQPSDVTQPSSVKPLSFRVPVHLQSVATLSNQLLRSGTSIGANNAEASNAVSKADYRNKSFIALKEARESLYWLELLHRNNYLSDEQYNSIYADCEELVKLLVHRCKKLDKAE